MESIKNTDADELVYKTEIDTQILKKKTIYGYQRGNGGEAD